MNQKPVNPPPPASSPLSATRSKSFSSPPDPRLVLPVIMGAGLGAWLAPWPVAGVFAFPAAGLFVLTWRRLPAQRGLLRVYVGFALFWGLSFALLNLWDKDVQGAALMEHGREGLIFSLRLFSLLGMALAVPLTMTPLTVGRTCAWYLARLGRVERKILSLPPLRERVTPRLEDNAWRCGLALSVMMSFLPRALATLQALRRSLALRAPHIRAHRRFALLCLAALRVLGAQTWDCSVSIAARDVYRPEPWERMEPAAGERKKKRFRKKSGTVTERTP